MSDEATARPQDIGRRHGRAVGAPTPETAAVLERYRSAMRAELDDALLELRPEREQLTIDGGAERMRPALPDRLRLWDLAIKIGREASAPGGSDLDDPPPAPASSVTPARAPRLTAKDRRSLGA